MPKVSIIIVNYNTRELLRECIESIIRFTSNITYEIIVVDNCSMDGSVEMVKVIFPNVKLIESDENLGFGRANNLAVKNSRGEYLFLLNSDARLLNNSILIFYNYLKNAQIKIGAVGGKLVDNKFKTSVSCGNFPTLKQEVFEYGLSKIFKIYYKNKLSLSLYLDEKNPVSVDYIMGADLFIKKSIFVENNGFDEDFFLYYEETELCYRLKQKSYTNIWIPGIEILHHWGESGKNKNIINFNIYKYMSESKYLYYKKCHGVLSAKLAILLSIPKIIKRHSINNLFPLILINLKILFSK